MKPYDPLKAPAPEEWLALDESQRIEQAVRYHQRARVKLPNVRVHAILHSIIETQIAMGDELPVRRTLERLLAEGLDRHDALHAIGSVLAIHLNEIVRADAPAGGDSNAGYWKELDQLTARKWLTSFWEEDELPE